MDFVDLYEKEIRTFTLSPHPSYAKLQRFAEAIKLLNESEDNPFDPDVLERMNKFLSALERICEMKDYEIEMREHLRRDDLKQVKEQIARFSALLRKLRKQQYRS